MNVGGLVGYNYGFISNCAFINGDYYCGKLEDGVTSSSIVTFDDKKCLKGGEVTFNYNGDSYKYDVSDDVIFGFGKGDSLKTNGFNDIIATCNASSVTLKDFTATTFNIERFKCR